MGDDELAELRRRRMEELQRQQMDSHATDENQKRQEAQIHRVLMQILEPAARERINTIKLTRPDFARAIEQQLVMLAQSGRVKGRISDDQFKTLLKQLVPQKKDFNITRR